MTHPGTVPGAPAPHADLSAALLAAETSGQLGADVWPALRSFLLTLADAAQTGDKLKLVAPQIDAVTGPLRSLIAARQAFDQARQALDAGYTVVAQAGVDPSQIAEAASSLAALADDLSARAQQLAELVQHYSEAQSD
jgi:enamine deaminase RidA (YjgF/YER057c/UK114 family)